MSVNHIQSVCIGGSELVGVLGMRTPYWPNLKIMHAVSRNKWLEYDTLLAFMGICLVIISEGPHSYNRFLCFW